MTTMDEVRQQLNRIEAEIDALLAANFTISGACVIVGGLSDISDNLGLVQAGEFRSGTGAPGYNFTGVRIGHPGFVYGSNTYNIVGVANDVMQFGLDATTGKAVAGAGNVVIDSSGIAITGGLSTYNTLRYVCDHGTTVCGIGVDQAVEGGSGKHFGQLMLRTYVETGAAAATTGILDITSYRPNGTASASVAFSQTAVPTAGTLISLTTYDNSWTPQGGIQIDPAGYVSISGIVAFKPPVLTTTQRDALAYPAAGQIIWNSTTSQLEDYNGAAWAAV